MLQSVTGNRSPVLQERSWPKALHRQQFPAADLVAWRWPHLLRPVSSPHILALIRPAQRQPPAIPTEVLAQGPHGHTNRCSDTSSCLWGRNPPLHQGSQACAHNQNSLLEGRCWWTLLDINSPHLWVREPGYTDTFKWLGARHNQH